MSRVETLWLAAFDWPDNHWESRTQRQRSNKRMLPTGLRPAAELRDVSDTQQRKNSNALLRP